MKISTFGTALAAAALFQLTAYADTTDTITVSGTPAVGETFTVNIRIESDSDIGYLNSSLEYDDSVIEFSGGDAWGGGGLITINSFPGEDSGVLDCALTFTAVGEGDSNITLTNGYVFSIDGTVLEQPDSSALYLNSLIQVQAFMLRRQTKMYQTIPTMNLKYRTIRAHTKTYQMIQPYPKPPKRPSQKNLSTNSP